MFSKQEFKNIDKNYFKYDINLIKKNGKKECIRTYKLKDKAEFPPLHYETYD